MVLVLIGFIFLGLEEIIMKIEPLVSVIVAVSNNEETIYDCVESIMRQSYKNLEILLVIEESYDRISVICSNLALIDYRIRIISAVHDLSSNFNAKLAAFYEGLMYAAGNYVAFVDSNDRLHCDMIQSLVVTCIKHQCQIACGRISIWDDSRNLCDSKKGTIRVYNRTAAFMSRKFTIEPYGKLFDIALFEDLCQDNFYLYNLYYKANKISVTERDMYYRLCESTSGIDIRFWHNSIMKYFKNRIQYFKKKERNLLELSHEYYCEFLADYYIYQLKNREDTNSVNKTYKEFRREFWVVRYNNITPFYIKCRLGLLNYAPKVYDAIIKVLRINTDLAMINNLKRL